MRTTLSGRAARAFTRAASFMLLLPTALGAAAGDAPSVLVHRFTLDEPFEWVSIELQPTATVWHRRTAGGATARVDDVRAVLGALEGIAVGVHCPGRTEGPVHYPCTFDVDIRHHDDGSGGGAIEGWISTTTRKLMQPGDGVVSALSTPRPEPGSIALTGEAGLLALVAPASLRAEVSQDRPLRLRVRVRPAPVAEEASGAGAIGKARGAAGPTQGVIVISTQPFALTPAKPVRDGGQRV